MTDDDFWKNRFHSCALAAGFLAAIEGKLGDSLYVRDLAYRMYKEGAFRDRVSTEHDSNLQQLEEPAKNCSETAA